MEPHSDFSLSCSLVQDYILRCRTYLASNWPACLKNPRWTELSPWLTNIFFFLLPIPAPSLLFFLARPCRTTRASLARYCFTTFGRCPPVCRLRIYEELFVWVFPPAKTGASTLVAPHCLRPRAISATYCGPPFILSCSFTVLLSGNVAFFTTGTCIFTAIGATTSFFGKQIGVFELPAGSAPVHFPFPRVQTQFSKECSMCWLDSLLNR